MRSIVNVLLVSVAAIVCASTVFSATIHVPADQPTIQAGINAAVNGDTVLVAPGEYTEILGIQSKNIVIMSASGASLTKITLPQDTSAFWITCANSVLFQLTGFTFESPFISAGINFDSCNALVEGNIFSGCKVHQNLINGEHGEEVTIRRNVFTRVAAPNAMIVFANTTPVVAINNTIDSTGRAVAAYCDGSIVRNNIITRCKYWAVYNSGLSIIEDYNCFWGNAANYVLNELSPTDITSDPLYQDASALNYSLQLTSPCINAGHPGATYNDPDGSRADIGAIASECARPRLLKVPQDFATIQDAVNEACQFDTVSLSPGTYFGQGNRDINLLGKRLIIVGAQGPDSTIIDCQGSEQDNHRAFTCISGEDSLTTIVGVTMSSGWSSSGGAIYCSYSSVRVLNCVFTDNHANDGGAIFTEGSSTSQTPIVVRGTVFRQNYAASSGGAVSLLEYGFSGSPIFEDCQFDSCSSSTGGGINIYGGGLSLNFTRCTFTGNSATYGGAFSGSTIYATFVDSDFRFNFAAQGGAIHIGGEAYGTLNGCHLESNSAQYGGAIYTYAMGRAYITGCEIRNNAAQISGGVGYGWSDDTYGFLSSVLDSNVAPSGAVCGGEPVSVYIQGCTIVCNGDSNSSSVFSNGYAFSLDSSIIAFNHGATFANQSDEHARVNCSVIYGNTGGDWVNGLASFQQINGNLSTTPGFCDFSQRNYQILSTSPCAPANNSCGVLIGALGVGCSGVPEVQQFAAQNEALMNVTDNTPAFEWLYFSPVVATQDSFVIAVGTDNDWQYAEKWNPAPVASSDTFVTYGGSPLADGETYYLRLRVHNGLAWSEWYQTSFRMNSVPAVPLLKAPIDLAPVTTSTPTLWVLNATDGENDALTYDFAGFHDTDCVAGPAINLTGVTSGVDSTGGVISEPLAENCRYWWRARSFDGFEYSDWSPYGQFMVNGSPEAPTAPILESPPLPDNKPVFTLLPTLSWLPSFDPDPSDTVRYKLELSVTANFSFVLPVDSLLTTQWTVTDSLMFGTRYWWRVTARDRNGLTAMSGVKDFWTWKLGDVNHSHGIDLSDLSLLIAYLTQTPRPDISPKRVGDLTGDCRIDLSDLSLMISYLTQGGVGISVGCE